MIELFTTIKKIGALEVRKYGFILINIQGQDSRLVFQSFIMVSLMKQVICAAGRIFSYHGCGWSMERALGLSRWEATNPLAAHATP